MSARSNALASTATATFALLVLLATTGCSGSSAGGGTGGGPGAGSGGAGGGGPGAGSGGAGGAGATGSGGNQGAGGAGGATGSGGNPGSGGSGGAAGATGTGGQADAGVDLTADRVDDVGPGGPTVDACFAGLRAAVGSFQIGTKASADGKYRVRLALETGNRFGTSGSQPWAAFRFAIETPDGNLCVKEEPALAQAYKGTLHNCGDTFELTVAGRRYLIAYPDTDPSRPQSSLKIFMGTTMVAGPIGLANGACMAGVAQCRSGGPC
jgi:hypothetical protein